jgi:16S rRNA G966 N2-methylase RsmD
LEKKANEIIEALSFDPLQQYIREHEQDDERALVLKNKEIFGIPSALISEQIAGRKKAKEKLPLFYHTPHIIYPPAINLEQSSSEQTALFKQKIIRNLFPSREATGADLTAGFGVDTFFLSKALHRVHCVEPQNSLLEIARHNHTCLGADNIAYHASSAESFIKEINQGFDFFYIDPSRRTHDRKKIHALQDSEPDVINLKNEIFKKSTILVIKASPLLDIQAGIAQLANVKKVFVISVRNECKEIVFLCEKDFAGVPIVEAVNLLEQNRDQIFEFTFPGEREAEVTFSDPLQYLYEPNASILKAGAFKSIARRFNLSKIQTNTHLYTAGHLVTEFPGRKFLIEKIVRPDPGEMKKYFPDGKANITTRNYPLTVEALKKRTGLKDGGDRFLIGFSGQQKKFLVVAKRV